MGEFRRLSESTIHEGFIWNVANVQFESPTGEVFQRDIVRSPGAVAVVPLIVEEDGTASVVLVTQYRPPFETDIIEIPAGMRDIDGEDTIEVARRELIEEAGLDAGSLELIGSIAPSSGMTDSVTTLYLATDCTPVDTDRHGPEEQFMTVRRVSLAESLEMIDRGEIIDAKTVAALFMTDRRLRNADG